MLNLKHDSDCNKLIDNLSYSSGEDGYISSSSLLLLEEEEEEDNDDDDDDDDDEETKDEEIINYIKNKKYETLHSYYHGNRTLVIFDWDDTLHPTSAINKSRININDKLDIDLIRKFCLMVYETLLTLIRLYGSSNIYIVSNADKLWIEKCLNKLSGGYFVNIYHLISLYDIQIISAKNEFSSKFPNNSTKWKQLTFEKLVKKHYLKYNQKLYLQHIVDNDNNDNNNKIINKQFSVVSIGDSHHEYIASKRCINRLNIDKNNQKKIILHRIKLLQNPSLKQLIQQYHLIKNISYLFKSETEEIDIDYAKEMEYYYKNRK